MQTVLIRKYSTFFDPVTNTQFSPVLDKSVGFYIGVANVDDSLIPHFKSNPAYELIDEAQYSALLTGHSAVDNSAAISKLQTDIGELTEDAMGLGPNAPQ